MLMLLEEFCCGQTRLLVDDCTNVVAALSRGGQQSHAALALLDSTRDLQTLSHQLVQWASDNLIATDDEWKTFLDNAFRTKAS